MLEIIKSDIFIIISGSLNLILIIVVLINIIKLFSINKKYNKFMNKLGNGNNLESMIKKYINISENIESKNIQLLKENEKINKKLEKCIQKVGILRYNAFKDTGSDLSFVVAILDEDNSGIVLNGIYSREASNIYAKPITKGLSTYTLSEEEKTAIEKAIFIDK